jgi:hypothetical protein
VLAKFARVKFVLVMSEVLISLLELDENFMQIDMVDRMIFFLFHRE